MFRTLRRFSLAQRSPYDILLHLATHTLTYGYLYSVYKYIYIGVPLRIASFPNRLLHSAPKKLVPRPTRFLIITATNTPYPTWRPSLSHLKRVSNADFRNLNARAPANLCGFRLWWRQLVAISSGPGHMCAHHTAHTASEQLRLYMYTDLGIFLSGKLSRWGSCWMRVGLTSARSVTGSC